MDPSQPSTSNAYSSGATNDNETISIQLVDLSLENGREFSSFSVLTNVLEQRTIFFGERWKICSGGQSVKSCNAKMKMKATKRYPEHLMYATVNYRCIHEGTFIKGDKRKEQATGKTPAKKAKLSMKIGCEAKMTVKANKDKELLYIEAGHFNHSHILAKPKEHFYPEDREASKEEERYVQNLVKLCVPAAKIRSHMFDETGKSFSKDDIHNTAKRNKSTAVSVEDETWNILKDMKEKDKDSQYTLVIDGESDVEIIFIQTANMRMNLEKYPEIVYLDGTYCLNNLGYPVYVFLTTDGELHGNVVAYAIVKDEKKVTLTGLLREFVHLNPVNIETVVLDKDAAEIAAVKAVLPDTNILLCRFHVAANLKDAASKYCTPLNKAQAKHDLQKMLYTTDEQEFYSCFNNLPDMLKQYMSKNWLPISGSWAHYQTQNIKTYGTYTNNHVERHNRTLKTLGSRNTSLPKFIAAVLKHDNMQQIKLRQDICRLQLTTKVVSCNAVSEKVTAQLQEVSSQITSLAFNLLKEEVDKMSTHDANQSVQLTDIGLVFTDTKGNLKIYDCAADSCTCGFFMSRELPCWHMLLYRSKHNLDLFPNIPAKWLVATFVQNVNVESGDVECVKVHNKPKQKLCSDVEKRVAFSDLCKSMANSVVACGH